METNDTQPVRQPTRPVAPDAESSPAQTSEDPRIAKLEALILEKDQKHAEQLAELTAKVAQIAASSQGGITADVLARTMTEMQQANREEAHRRREEKLARAFAEQERKDVWIKEGALKFDAKLNNAPGMDLEIGANSTEEAWGKFLSYWGMRSIGGKRTLTITPTPPRTTQSLHGKGVRSEETWGS